MREELTKIEIFVMFLMNNRNIMLGISLPYGKSRETKMRTNMLRWMLNCFLIYPYLHREYYLFGQNSESFLEQYNIFFAFLQKVNNSIATKLCVKLIYNCKIVLKKNAALHNTMTKNARNNLVIELCSAAFFFNHILSYL